VRSNAQHANQLEVEEEREEAKYNNLEYVFLAVGSRKGISRDGPLQHCHTSTRRLSPKQSEFYLKDKNG
jgi:hypothetical protein